MAQDCKRSVLSMSYQTLFKLVWRNLVLYQCMFNFTMTHWRTWILNSQWDGLHFAALRDLRLRCIGSASCAVSATRFLDLLLAFALALAFGVFASEGAASGAVCRADLRTVLGRTKQYAGLRKA